MVIELAKYDIYLVKNHQYFWIRRDFINIKYLTIEKIEVYLIDAAFSR